MPRVICQGLGIRDQGSGIRGALLAYISDRSGFFIGLASLHHVSEGDLRYET